MKHSSYFKLNYTNTNNSWKILETNFNNLKNNNTKLQNKIPKKIHQIWLGSQLPARYNELTASWKNHHPDWEYKLWTDNDIESFNLYNKDLYAKTTNYGEKSDILRYEILYRHGGIYADCDFECLKPHDELSNYCDFYAGLGYAPDPIILCGLIGSVPNHPILKACIENMKRDIQGKESFDDILKRSSVFHFTDCFFKHYTQNSIAFPVTFFYPLPDIQRDSHNIKSFIKPESFAIHYWHLSWNNGKIG
ncbi:MAG: glycosyltransferase [Candidatus Babeliales bacterium]|nr:glycosyltransferase [Candidatus Babeliales bacterium]